MRQKNDEGETVFYRIVYGMLTAVCFVLAFVAAFTVFVLKVSAAPKEEVNTYIRGWMDYDDCCCSEDTFYASKGNPVLTAEASEDLIIHAEIKYEGENGGWVQSLEEYSSLEYVFEEGRYTVKLYGKKEGSSECIYAKGFPLNLVYDNTPPENPVAEIIAPGATESKGEILSSETVTVNFSSEDSLSGISTMFVQQEDMDVMACDRVVIESGGCRKLIVWSEDKCGNLSDKCIFDKNILVDAERPEISWKQKDENGERPDLDITFRDEVSGLSYAAVRLDDELLESHDLSDEDDGHGAGEKKVRFTLSEEEYEALAYDSDHSLKLYCRDMAGNDKSVVLSFGHRDDSPPQVKLSGIRDGAVTDGSVQLHLDVSDDNMPSDPAGYVKAAVKHTYVDPGSSSEDEKSESYEADPYDGLVFYDDGRYEVTVTAWDPAGNTAAASLGFIIDNTPPLIRGLEAYDGNVTDRFVLKDKDMENMFLDASLIRYQMYLNGRNYRENEEVTTPGKYRFEVAAVDQTGNMSRDSVSFTIPGEEQDDETNVMFTDKGFSLSTACADLTGKAGAEDHLKTEYNGPAPGPELRSEPAADREVKADPDRKEVGENRITFGNNWVIVFFVVMILTVFATVVIKNKKQAMIKARNGQ